MKKREGISSLLRNVCGQVGVERYWLADLGYINSRDRVKIGLYFLSRRID